MSSPTQEQQRSPKQSEPTHYQTFPTNPPKSRGRPLPAHALRRTGTDSSLITTGSSKSQHDTPLPKKQLLVLAVISLAEQTALNSISPYLPDMASTFPEVKPGQVGVYVGLIASAFALAQFATNFFWGWLSDRIGRKPVILAGVFLTSACFVAFGFCRTFWQAVLVQAFMGLVNGNQGVVSTCLGEITDRSNQSKAFIYLPVVYGLGGITGPMVGGLLVGKSFQAYPYLLPNLVSCAVLLAELLIAGVFLDESLEDENDLPPLRMRLQSLFASMWQFHSSSRPTYVRPGRVQQWNTRGAAASGESADGEDEHFDSPGDESAGSSLTWTPPDESTPLRTWDILNRDTVLILVTYLIFQLANVAYNSLYPVFAQGDPPTGRNLTPKEIGVSLAFSGLFTIVFQIFLFNRLREKLGNKASYRTGLALFVVAFLLMPWVGYKGKESSGVSGQHVILWLELGAILIVKTIASVGGLTSALLLITNSAPDNRVLGALNGLAQTLSAAGRAVGPFISGGLFSLATRIRPKGEAMAFGVFGGVAFVGFLLSFGIRGGKLEAEDEDEDDREAGNANGDSDAEHAPNERSSLVGGRK